MTTIIIKNSSTSSAVPVSGDLTKGELAVNVTDKKLYTKDNGGSVVKLVGGLGNQEASAVAITGGAIDGTPIGGTTASTASFTTLSASGNVTLSGGTANGVLYLNGSKVATSGSALTFDGSKLGIGNQSTNGQLVVSDAISTVVSASQDRRYRAAVITGGVYYGGDIFGGLDSAGATAFGISTYDGSASPVTSTIFKPSNTQFYINGSEAMRLTSTGLGVGTSSPAYKLDVNGNARFSGGQAILGNATANYLYFTNGSKLVFSDTVGNERVIIDSSGNLGLGVTPSAWGGSYKGFQVAATGVFASNGVNGTALAHNAYYDGTNDKYLTTGAASRVFQFNGGIRFDLAASGTAGDAITFTQAMTLDASGNWLLGTTSTIANARMSVVGNVQDTLVRLQNQNVIAPGGLDVHYSGAATNNSDNWFYLARDSGATRFYVKSNGGIANFSANDSNLSDRREKTNFAPSKSYLETICAIPVQTFNYIDQNMEEDPGLTLGVVAQDVQSVAPELVMESNWGTKEEPKMRLSIYQTDLQYALMKALQELKAEFDAYKASHP